MSQKTEETLEGASLTEEAVMKRCWDENRHVIITYEDDRTETCYIGISRRDHKTITKKGTGGLDLFQYKMKSIRFLVD